MRDAAIYKSSSATVALHGETVDAFSDTTDLTWNDSLTGKRYEATAKSRQSSIIESSLRMPKAVEYPSPSGTNIENRHLKVHIRHLGSP